MTRFYDNAMAPFPVHNALQLPTPYSPALEDFIILRFIVFYFLVKMRFSDCSCTRMQLNFKAFLCTRGQSMDTVRLIDNKTQLISAEWRAICIKCRTSRASHEVNSLSFLRLASVQKCNKFLRLRKFSRFSADVKSRTSESRWAGKTILQLKLMLCCCIIQLEIPLV